MSNYQARHRAIRAERAAERCAELCEEMRYECRQHESMHYEKAKREFDLKNAYLIAHMDNLQKSISDLALADFKPFVIKK